MECGLIDPALAKPINNEIASQNPWAEALKTLNADEQSQFNQEDADISAILSAIQKETETKKKLCLEKGWKVYHKKNGEDVRLRHIFEKISVWVTEVEKLVDVGVSFDQSGHAAAPWAVIKILVTVGNNDFKVFSQMSEAVESISGLLARYSIFEKLYLHEDCEATLKLYNAMCTLYAAILRYLLKAKKYFGSNSLKRFGLGLLDTMRKEYDELWSKITEADVDKLAKLVDVELQRKLTKDASDRYEILQSALSRLQQPIIQISDQISFFQERFEQKDRREMFRWMSKIEYRKHHDDLSKDLLAHSGRWLLQSREYAEWGQSDVSSIIWLHGIPGSGKTRLVSTVIKSMLETYPTSSAALIAFFYCLRSEAETERAMPVEVMRAILKQLTSTESDLPIRAPIAKEYKDRKKEADKDGSSLKELSIEDCTRLILQVTEESPAVFIIDALDECDEGLRYQLLEALDEIVSKSTGMVKILVSSRDDIDIHLHLSSCRNMSIGADQNAEDIQRFIDFELERLIIKRLLLSGEVSEQLRRKTVKVLNRGAQGMFRWVALSLDFLRQIQYKPDFEKALGKLPRTLSGLYDKIYDQIEKTEAYGRTVAFTALKWLLCAERLLSEKEFLVAIQMSAGITPQSSSDCSEDSGYGQQLSSETDSVSETESEADSITQSDIIRLCRNLVVFDSNSGVFRFAHQSVLEYLRQRSDYPATELQAFATETCLDVCMGKLPQRSDAITAVEGQDLLRTYAQFYWPVHYKKSENHLSPERKKKILNFFLHGSDVSAFYVAWAKDIAGYGSVFEINHRLGLDSYSRLGFRLYFASYLPSTPLIAACAFGFGSLMEEFDKLPSTDWNQHLSRGPNSATLLHIAAEENQLQIIRWLLERGVDTDSKNGESSGTPLLTAARNGHEGVVQLLFEHQDVDANMKDEIGRSPLSWAAGEGQKKVVELLLEREDIEINMLDKWGMTPLAWAADNGQEEIVRLLVDREDSVTDLPDDTEGITPLARAAKGGHEAVVRFLIQREDVNPDSQDRRGLTPLAWAARQDEGATVKLLIQHAITTKNIDINREDERRRTPLLWAVLYGHEAVVEQLLKRQDINADKQDDTGETPLSWAARYGHEDVVEQLLKRQDVNADKQDNAGKTPLLWAAHYGHEAVVEQLIRHAEETGKVEVDQKNEDGETPLVFAVENNHEAVARLLLKTGKVDVNYTNIAGETLLSLAREWPDGAMVRLLESYIATGTDKF